MKRALLFLLVTALLLSNGTISAFATTHYISENGTPETDVSYNASVNGGADNADWVVTVPATLTVGEEYTVTASGRWAPYDILSVTASSQVNMYLNGNVNADYATLPVTYNAIALCGSYTGEVSQNEKITVDKNKIMDSVKFGIWEGILSFDIEVQYDENYDVSAIKGAELCVHQWGNSVNLEDGRHFHTCQICNLTEYAAHIYEVTGELTRACVCGDTLVLEAADANYAVDEEDGVGKTYADLGDAIAYAREHDATVIILKDMTEVYDLTMAAQSYGTSENPVVIDPNGKITLLHYGNISDIKLMADYSAANILAAGSVITVTDGTNIYTVDFDSTSDENTQLVPALAKSEDGKVMDIYTKQGLEMLAQSVNSGSAHAGWNIRLCKDIDLKNENWTPIGKSKVFSGSFDGGGHKISNLKIESTGGSLGLFGKVSPSGATYIKNIKLENMEIFGKGTNVAGLIGEATSGNSTATGNYLVINNIEITGKVKIDGYCGVAAVMCAGNAAEISDIVINAEEGSYVSNTKHGTTTTWNLVASVKSFGYVSKISNITSNLDVHGKFIGVGGLFAIVGSGSSNTYCRMNDVHYSGTVYIVNSSTSLFSGKYYYQYSGLLVGAPRFGMIADQETCTSDGKLVLTVDGEIKNSNDMGEWYAWGTDLFGAARDNNYTNKSFSKTYSAE